jgi:transcriptional regulator with XRE-family HTH domain
MLMSATIVRRNVVTLERWQAFARTIKEGRVSHGWPMRKFARMAGISLGYLGVIETSRCPPPSDEVLLRMAGLLEIPAPTLFTLAGRLPPEVLSEFWQHPAIVPILSTIPGMSLDDAQTFCRQVVDSLPQPGTA